jgi:hypothetical protein
MYGTDLQGLGLFTIDKTNASWSQIANFTAAGTGTAGSFTDLTFTLDGQLYGMNTTAIYEINKATAVFNPTFFPIEDSSGNPVTVSGHFAAVPEPTTLVYGLSIAALFTRLGSLRLRRRRSTPEHEIESPTAGVAYQADSAAPAASSVAALQPHRIASSRSQVPC